MQEAPDLTGQVEIESAPCAYGGFSAVHHGVWRQPTCNYEVAVKIFRGIHQDPGELAIITRRIQRETRIWYQLAHENILPFYGICRDVGPSPALVSPFCKYGNIEDYLRKFPNVDRFHLICGIAKGLSYLHTANVIHGDVKPHNVLVNDRGVPCLCDFGRSKIINHRGYTTGIAGTTRFLAPELLAGPADNNGPDQPETQPQPQLTTATDIYAFSMVVLQILTSIMPFYYFPQDSMVVHYVVNGTRPDPRRYNMQPPLSTLWGMLEACWAQMPAARPSMAAVLQLLTNP